MRRIKGSRMAVPLAAAIVLSLLAPPPARAYYDKVHRMIALRALELIEREYGRDGVYAELLRFRGQILEGAVAEDYGDVDGNERAMRHYYDPDSSRPKKGVPYYGWYRLWQLKGAKVTPPPGGFYDGALDWARDGAGTRDLKNWAGAIRSYGASLVECEEAYLRLGHVVHLLGDMTVLDHVMNVPHPGSYRKDYAETRYGFEGFCEDFLDTYAHLLEGKSIARFSSFDDYFNRLARLTKAVSKKWGMTAPLGLKGVGIPVPGGQSVTVNDLGRMDINFLMTIDIPWEPDIDVATEGTTYTEYAVECLNHAIEYCAGMMLDFCDIVRRPLYVERVSISGQRGGLYLAVWEDTVRRDPDGIPQVASRELIIEESSALDNLSPITVKFEFGANRLRTDDVVDPASVRVRISGSNGQVIQTPPTRLGGGRGGTDRSVWQVTFMPELPPRISEVEYRLEIAASDKAPRRGRPSGGTPLDSDPGTAYYVGPKPPYSSTGYEPGADTRHTFKVVRGSRSMIATPAYILVRPSDEEENAGELVIATVPEQGDMTIKGPFDSTVELYKVLCPFLDELRQKRFKIGEMRVTVPREYLEKCEIPGFGADVDWKKGVDPGQKLRTDPPPAAPPAPAPKPAPPPPAPKPSPAAGAGLAAPRTLADVPAVIKKMGFEIRKTGGCRQGTCYSVIVDNAAVASSYGFSSGADRLFGETFGGETTYDAVFWGELRDGEVTVWVDWLEKSYTPKERSFPPFVRLFDPD